MPPKNSQSQGTKAKPKAAAKEEKKEAKLAKTAVKGKFTGQVYRQVSLYKEIIKLYSDIAITCLVLQKQIYLLTSLYEYNLI
jgi:hypothetical protein